MQCTEGLYGHVSPKLVRTCVNQNLRVLANITTLEVCFKGILPLTPVKTFRDTITVNCFFFSGVSTRSIMLCSEFVREFSYVMTVATVLFSVCVSACRCGCCQVKQDSLVNQLLFFSNID